MIGQTRHSANYKNCLHSSVVHSTFNLSRLQAQLQSLSNNPSINRNVCNYTDTYQDIIQKEYAILKFSNLLLNSKKLSKILLM